MKYLLLSLFSFSYLLTIAQPPAGGGQARGNFAPMAANGHFFGKIVDAKTNKGLNGATVLLFTTKKDSTGKPHNVPVATVLTAANGDFDMDKLPVRGNFTLRVTNVGYIDYSTQVAFAPGSFDKDLGNIKLQQSETNLAGVTVTSSAKPFFEMGVDRKIFNVDKNIVTTGQTATEVMKQIPSLNVDIDGNVTLRNSAPTIFVDGRPTTLTLDQIPADIIDKVELITNPSAKYDASGGNAGILNIVLKKNRKVGYNGNIRAGVDSRGRANGGFDLNMRQNKFNYFLSGNLNQRKSRSWTDVERNNYINNEVDSIHQYSNGINNGSFAFIRGGFDYFIDNRNTFTISGAYVHGQFNNNDDQTIDSTLKGQFTTRNLREAITKRDFHNVSAQLGYKHNFAKDGHDITADVNLNSSHNSNNGNYDTRYFTSDGYQKYSPYLQRIQQGGYNKFIILQSDYENPVTDKVKIEAGVRGQIRNFENDNIQAYYDTSVKGYVTLANISSQYKYTDQVYAAYATYSKKLKNFNYQVGLRAESSNYNGNLIGKDSTFKVSYPISLFPSAFLTFKLSDKQDMQANYSRRINRPNFYQILPFIDNTDPLNLSIGNPNLKPEFTNSFEVNYSNTYTKGANLLISTYYKHSDNLITNFIYRGANPDKTINKADSVYFSTFVNANSSSTYGLEFTNRILLLKIWDMTLNVNLYNSKINGTNLGNDVTVQRWSWFTKLNNNFKLPKGFSIQLFANYQSKTVLPASSGSARNQGSGGGFGPPPMTSAQGYIYPQYSFDAAIRKDWNWKGGNGVSITLGINDFARTQRYKSYSESYFSPTEYFTQISTRRRDPQVIRLNFNYRFGKFDASLFKRRNAPSGAPAGTDMMGGG
jgi:outer membrane receptor protein involved in Fe transport